MSSVALALHVLQNVQTGGGGFQIEPQFVNLAFKNNQLVLDKCSQSEELSQRIGRVESIIGCVRSELHSTWQKYDIASLNQLMSLPKFLIDCNRVSIADFKDGRVNPHMMDYIEDVSAYIWIKTIDSEKISRDVAREMLPGMEERLGTSYHRAKTLLDSISGSMQNPIQFSEYQVTSSLKEMTQDEFTCFMSQFQEFPFYQNELALVKDGFGKFIIKNVPGAPYLAPPGGMQKFATLSTSTYHCLAAAIIVLLAKHSDFLNKGHLGALSNLYGYFAKRHCDMPDSKSVAHSWEQVRKSLDGCMKKLRMHKQ